MVWLCTSRVPRGEGRRWGLATGATGSSDVKRPMSVGSRPFTNEKEGVAGLMTGCLPFVMVSSMR